MSEVAELQKLKAADTNDPNAKIEVWDWRYYSNQRNKQKYAVDKEALRAYFPFQKCSTECSTFTRTFSV